MGEVGDGPGAAGGSSGNGGWLAGAGVLGLTVVVAAASSGSPAWAPVGEGGRDRWVVLALVLGLAALITLATLVITLLGRLVVRPVHFVPLRLSLLRAVPVATVVLTVVALVAIARTAPPSVAPDVERPERERAGRPPSAWGFSDHRASPVVPGGGTEEVAEEQVAPDAARFPLLLLILFMAAAAVLIGAIIRSRRPAVHPRDEDDSDAEQEAARDTVAETIEAMLADADPRTAIIGAYARLLEGLAASGGGRRAHEAPVEHLRRALALLDVRPDPLRTLIGLFEVARFSTHEVTTAHRDSALDSLHAVAWDLAQAGPTPSPGGRRPTPEAPDAAPQRRRPDRRLVEPAG